MISTNEAGNVKAESVKDKTPVVDNAKQRQPETKVEIEETLASKLEEKDEENHIREIVVTKHQKAFLRKLQTRQHKSKQIR